MKKNKKTLTFHILYISLLGATFFHPMFVSILGCLNVLYTLIWSFVFILLLVDFGMGHPDMLKSLHRGDPDQFLEFERSKTTAFGYISIIGIFMGLFALSAKNDSYFLGITSSILFLVLLLAGGLSQFYLDEKEKRVEKHNKEYAERVVKGEA